jgi:protein-tyrosine phosphatase
VNGPIGDGVFRLLVVCTANQCRSPMGQVMAAELLDRRGVDAVVASCGVMEGGSPASRGSVRAMSRRGLDLSTHVSQQMDSDTVGAADLILTMERRHIASVAELSIEAVRRTFTLKELADLAVVVGPRPPTTTVGSWIASADRMRRPEAVMTASTEDDVRDPMGGPSRAYRAASAEIDQLLRTVLDAVFPLSSTD